MSETASNSSGVASRYATAMFGLARDAGEIETLQADLAVLAEALAVSNDFVELIDSPIYSRAQQSKAVAAIGKKLGLSTTTKNTLGLMADNRRLFVLSALIDAVRALIAIEKGEVTAEVTSAKKLTKAQETKLAGVLKKAVGKDVTIKAAVDASLIGGLVVKVGSRMIDTSIALKLANLQNAMKEVG